MTVENPMAIVRPSNSANFAMDVSVSGQELYQPYLSSDHILPSESLVHELSYAPSPDSLYMYDQEKQDRQAITSMCGTESSAMLPASYGRCFEECDLKPQLENSNDLMLPSGSCLDSLSMAEFGEFNWDEKDKEFVDMEDVFQDRKDVNQGPTLAQLNFKDSFTDDRRGYRSATCNQSQAPSTASNDDWTGFDDFTRADPCGPSKSSSYPTPSSTNPMNWNEISQGMPGSSTASDVKYPTMCSPPRPNPLPTHPPMQYTILKTVVKTESPGFTSCSASMGHQSSDNSDLANRKKSALHKMLLQGQVTGQATPSTEEASKITPCLHTAQTRKRPSQEDIATVYSNNSNSVEQKWEEIKQFIHAGSGAPCESQDRVKRERLDSGSSVLTSLGDLDVGDESEDSDAESHDEDGDYQSDQDSSDSDASGIASPASKSKEKQYFWQYNVQSKGPKGKKLCFTLDTSDPHVLPNFEDPVFDPGHRVPGITHGGKARRGDGNDIYPNPKKLCQIGNELKRLNKRINDFTPLTDMPASVRSKSRKEKNKLASRACRLKKKAQHEANKIKLMGLEQEHCQLLRAIQLSKRDLLKRVKGTADDDTEKLMAKLERHIQAHLKHMIAGHSTDFVNGVIKLVNAGDPKGGLDI